MTTDHGVTVTLISGTKNGIKLTVELDWDELACRTKQIDIHGVYLWENDWYDLCNFLRKNLENAIDINKRGAK